MRLKALELHGFKSFADKTKFEFHSGVTGIVGPNGCGKSNVVDAVRWVLGETSAKALRGGEMADVIFNGTDKRKAVGMAEVRLTFTDCEGTLGTEYNEVSIGRRVYRDGKGEYRLNNTPCRLKDIHGLFMDTGIGRSAYSIMEQGKIDLLLSSKPEDRRAVFEEAAGITRYKGQKKEALRKLEYTEANLLRVVDIIEEVKRQMNSLNRQAGKARRYQALLEDVRVLDTHHSHRKYAEFVAEKSELENSVRALTQDQERLHREIEQKDQDIIAARDALHELEAEIGEQREQVMQLQSRAQAAENRIQFNEERNEELDALVEQHGADIAATNANLAQQEDQMRATSETLVRMEDNIHRQREQLDDHHRKNAELRESKASIEDELRKLHALSNEAESTLLSVQAQLKSNLNQIESDRERNAQLVKEITALDSEREQKTEEENTLRSDIAAKNEALAKAKQELAATEKQYQQAQSDHESLQKRLAAKHRTAAEKQSRLEVLQQLVASGEGLEEGTQSILKGLDQPDFYGNGVRGILSSFIEVDPDFIPALEAALGNHLQAILVSDPAMAESMIDTLAKEKLGLASIVPEQFISGSDGSQMMTVPERAVGWALDKVRVQEKVRPLVEHLLANVLIVDSLSTALAMRPDYPVTRFATMDGNTVSADGIIHGGAATEGSGSILQRQQEIRDLEGETRRLEADLANLQDEADAVSMQIRDLKQTVEERREAVQQARVAVSTLEGQLSLVERELEQMKAKLDNVNWEQGELFKRQETVESVVAELEEKRKRTETELEERRSRKADLESALQEAARREQESSELVNELRTSLAVEEKSYQSLQEQKEPIASRMRELEELLGRRQSEIANYRERIDNSNTESESLRAEIVELREQAKTVGTGIASLSETRATRAEAVQMCESALVETRRALNTSNDQKGKEEIKITQIDLRIENIEEMILQRYQVRLDAFEPDPHALLAAIAEQKKAWNRRQKRAASRAAAENGEPIETEPAVEEESAEESEPSPEEIAHAVEGGPDWAFIEMVVGDLKQRLDSMGPVNLDAIEEYEELEERYNFLSGQHEDLVNSKAELLRVISKINRKTKEMFSDTFAKVRDNFKLMFKELFGDNARANLVLIDDEDPLESGIDVIAKPPGKKLQSITLLSGGERSMTAVALLFAIYMVKPSPFCVLDELDAPLDESNIGRFIKMLNRFIEQSQFVIVTHNKRTMNRCDVMYGVTMEEFGISKHVGMKFTSDKDAEDREAEAPAASI